MAENMAYWQAVEVLSTGVYRRADPEECRAYLAVMEEIKRLRDEVEGLQTRRPRGWQIGDGNTQINTF